MQLNRIAIILILSFLKLWFLTSQDKMGTKNDYIWRFYRRKHISTHRSLHPLENQKHSVDQKFKDILKLNKRIVGGYPANIEDYPFVARLAVKNDWGCYPFCGATIVSLRWIFTAAHCIVPDISVNELNRKYVVLSNSTSLSEYTSEHRIVRYLTHDEFVLKTLDNDIGVIKVKEPFSGVNEKPIQYAKSDYVYKDDTSVTVLGWGATKEPNETDTFESPELLYANLKLSNLERCRGILKLLTLTVTDRMVCAYAPGKDTCSGDSGGPLIQNNLLIGISSQGAGCARPGVPGAYTRISMFSKWIKSKVCKKYRRNILRI